TKTNAMLAASTSDTPKPSSKSRLQYIATASAREPPGCRTTNRHSAAEASARIGAGKKPRPRAGISRPAPGKAGGEGGILSRLAVLSGGRGLPCRYSNPRPRRELNRCTVSSGELTRFGEGCTSEE